MTRVQRLAERGQAAAPVLLALSVVARLIWSCFMPYGAPNFVDLHVYVYGAAALDHPGTLYSYTYAGQMPDFPLPFTYPAFAALVFYPLHLLPFGLVIVLWQLSTIAALYGAIRISQRLLGVAVRTGRRTAMLWTAGTMWVEPVHSTIEYGQVGIFLMLAVLWAVYTTRWWLAGVLVGLAAGLKLTPAIAGVYLIGARRWGAAAFSVVVFLATIGVSALVVGDEAGYYFTDLLGDAHRVGPVGSMLNQSWRGGISRILGHDAGAGPLVLIAVVLTGGLCLLAWRALDGSDRLGRLLVVELFGLMLSPISWTHHWVWIVPLMIWLFYGPFSEHRGTRILGWGWVSLTILHLPWWLTAAQPAIWQISRPWYLAWAGLVYIVGALVTLVWIAIHGSKFGRSRDADAANKYHSGVPASVPE